MSWFIESWAVSEGCAFAVHRNYTGPAANPIDHGPPEQTVYISPPHFVPMPVAYATALAAARRRFQEKLTDKNGQEVAFDSLERLIELVRRAYVASGAGSAPPADNLEPEEPVPQGPKEGHIASEELDETETATWNEAFRRLRSAETTDERSDTATFLANAWTETASAALYRFCLSVAQAMGREANARFTALSNLRPSPLRTRQVAIAAYLERDARDFILLGAEMMDLLSDDSCSFMHSSLLAFEQGSAPSHHRPMRRGGCWPSGTSDDLSRALMSGLLHRLPCPIAWGPYENLKRLGDHLAAAIADRGYLKSVTSLERFLPLLTCALALAAAESYRFRLGGPFRDASLVRERAFQWLMRETPSSQLDGIPIASMVIEQVLAAATSATGRRGL